MIAVVPLAGTWIEIASAGNDLGEIIVVPLAGTWIEIRMARTRHKKKESFPSRERGLKWSLQNPVMIGYMSFPSRERGLKFLQP